MDEEKIDQARAAAAGDSAAGDPVPGDTVDVADTAALLAAVTAERDQLAKERAELYDQLLRLRAEFENFRRRSQRERAENAEYAAMEAVRSLVPVLDDFERALKHETADREYASGVEMIYGKLFEILKRLGLEPLESEGQPFDPYVHHAVEMKTTGEAPDHTVLEQLQRGYNFKGKLLRPAMVKVAVNP